MPEKKATWESVLKYAIISAFIFTAFRMAFTVYAHKNTTSNTALVTEVDLVPSDYWTYTYTYFYEGEMYSQSINDRLGMKPLPYHTGDCLGIEVSVMHPSESFIKYELEDDSETCTLLRKMVRDLGEDMPFSQYE